MNWLRRHQTARLNDAMLLLLLIVVGVAAYFAMQLEPIPGGEDNFVENTQAGLLFAAAILFGLKLPKIEKDFRILFAFLSLASAFLFLEEISYGQRLFGYETPEAMSANEQNEVNLHNYPLFMLLTLLMATGIVVFGTVCFFKRNPIRIGQFILVPSLSRLKWLCIMLASVALAFGPGVLLGELDEDAVAKVHKFRYEHAELREGAEAAVAQYRADGGESRLMGPLVAAFRTIGLQDGEAQVLALTIIATELLETLLYAFVLHLALTHPRRWASRAVSDRP